MKVSFVSLVYALIITASLSAIVGAQRGSDSCSSNLELKDLVLNASSLHQCLVSWQEQDFVLRYGETATGEWSFLVSAPESNSYVAVGFSRDGVMIGSSAIVGWNPPDGTARPRQYHLGGKTPSQVAVDQGDLDIVNGSLQFLSQASRLYLAFTIKADQPTPYVLHAIGPEGVFPSAPDYQLTEHRRMVSFSVNYATGVQKKASSRPYSRLRKSHGVMNLLSWGVLLPIGVMMARYLKEWDPMWFYAHAVVQCTAFVLGVISISLGLVLEDKSDATNVSSHKGLGITILVIACLQITALLARPDKGSKWRKYWNWYHQNMGRILVIFAIANIYYGISLADPGKAWNIGYGFVILVLISASIALEMRKWKKRC